MFGNRKGNRKSAAQEPKQISPNPFLGSPVGPKHPRALSSLSPGFGPFFFFPRPAQSFFSSPRACPVRGLFPRPAQTSLLPAAPFRSPALLQRNGRADSLPGPPLSGTKRRNAHADASSRPTGQRLTPHAASASRPLPRSPSARTARPSLRRPLSDAPGPHVGALLSPSFFFPTLSARAHH